MSPPIPITIGDDNELHTPWGVIRHGNPQPGKLGPLMLATPTYVADLMRQPTPERWVTAEGRRIFAHYRCDRTWTWELFPAYFTDNQGPAILIGRWPD